MVKDATETHECLAFIKRPDLLEENRKAGWRRFRACRLFFIRREGDRAEVAVTVFRDEADTWQHGHNIADAIVRRKFNPKDFDYKLVTEVIKGDWHARPSR